MYSFGDWNRDIYNVNLLEVCVEVQVKFHR